MRLSDKTSPDKENANPPAISKDESRVRYVCGFRCSEKQRRKNERALQKRAAQKLDNPPTLMDRLQKFVTTGVGHFPIENREAIVRYEKRLADAKPDLLTPEQFLERCKAREEASNLAKYGSIHSPQTKKYHHSLRTAQQAWFEDNGLAKKRKLCNSRSVSRVEEKLRAQQQLTGIDDVVALLRL